MSRMKISFANKKIARTNDRATQFTTQLVVQPSSERQEIPYNKSTCHHHERQFVAAIVQLLSLGVDLGQRKQTLEKVYAMRAEELTNTLNQLREICRHSRRFVISIAELRAKEQIEDAKIKAVNVLIPMRHEASILRDEVELLLEDKIQQH